jgi:BirA family biotin operon repressor/biotin-[acetyl-CoA-carboxylase] ligase
VTALLDRLLREPGMHTIESLSLALRLARADVSGQLQRLREAGCVLDEHPQQGVRLVHSGLATWADYIESRRPRRIEVYRSTASTQDVARRWVESGGDALDGATVVADVQTAGRGRLGRAWVAQPGDALLLSYVSAAGSLNHDQLTSATAVALAEAIEAVGPTLSVRIKWPNDLLVDGRKLAGILVERSRGAAIIGIGVNVAATPGQHTDAACLRGLGVTADRLTLLDETLRRLDAALTGAAGGDHVAAWRARCLGFSGPVRLQSDGRIVEGEVLDVDPAQGLLMRTRDGAIVHLPAATTGRV